MLLCIIHQEALCAKTVNFEEVMNAVVQIVNLLRGLGPTHRQFRDFLESLDSDHNDVPYFYQVR